MESLNSLLYRLLQSKIDFVLIGGYAAVLHGSSQVTHDLEICSVMTDSNLEKLREAFQDINPKHRMNPNFKPSLMEYPAKDQTINNYYLETDLGVLDILKEAQPVGSFEKIKQNSILVTIFGFNCRVISLDDLIEIKSSMKRPKDKATLGELLIVKDRILKKP